MNVYILKYSVLILVLVEVVLGEESNLAIRFDLMRLNPCFSGSCSWSTSLVAELFTSVVLILVLVEVVLGV